MSTPRTRPDPPVKSASSRSHHAAILEPKLPGTVARSDAELRRVIESAASRLLVLAISRGGDERDPDEE